MEIFKILEGKVKNAAKSECGCNDFKTEFADEVRLDNYTKGVTFACTGEELQLTYSGLLARSGANQVYAVVGYGTNNDWKEISTYPMYNTNQQTFELTVPIKDESQINVVFKDSSDNWDNNSGKNYTFYTQ